MAFITLPQNPVVAGQSGHLADHENAESALAALWGAVQQSLYNVCAPPYNADATGVADSTTAILNAITAAHNAGGGVVCLPEGTFKVSSLTFNNGTTGYKNVRVVGAGMGTVMKKSGNGVLLSMSGPSSDLTGATHCRWCSLENMTVDGGNFTGLLLQTYYADDLTFRDVHFANNNDAGHQSAEFWDSRFVNCVFDSLGSTTANTTAPATWLCNTVAGSGFGASTDTVNQIYFWGCRWEGNRSGAIRIERGPGGGSGQPSGIFFTDCKVESIVINGGGPTALYVDSNSQFVDVEHLYVYAGGFYSGYSTAQDVISFSPQVGSLRDVRIFNASASAVIANGVTVNSPLGTGLVSLDNVRGKYTTAPTGAHLNFGGTNTGPYRLNGVNSDNGSQVGGTIPSLMAANQPLNLVSGSVSDASFATTPPDGTQAVDTLNKRLWLRHSSGAWSRIALNTVASSVTSTTTIANTASLSTLQSATVAANEPQSGSVYVVNGYGTYSVTGTPTLTFALYWGGTGGTLLVSIPAITAASGITAASFSYEARVTFRSTTSVTVELKLDVATSTGTDATSRFTAVSTAPVTVTTTGSSALAVGFTWSAASASNTISLLGGLTSKVN